MFLGFRFLVWIPSFFIASGRGTWKEKISTPILELCLCSSDQKSKLDYKSKERCSKCLFKSFFQSQRSNSKKHCILFEQNHELFQGEFYRTKEVGKGFCWCKLNSFSNTSVGPQINSTSLKEKKALFGHRSYDVELDWMFLITNSFSQSAGDYLQKFVLESKNANEGKNSPLLADQLCEPDQHQ